MFLNIVGPGEMAKLVNMSRKGMCQNQGNANRLVLHTTVLHFVLSLLPPPGNP